MNNIRKFIRIILEDSHDANKKSDIETLLRSAFDELVVGDIDFNSIKGTDLFDAVIYYSNASLDDITAGIKALEDKDVLGGQFEVMSVKPTVIVLRFKNSINESQIKEEDELEEKSASKSQQRFMGQVRAIQTGELNPEELNPKYRESIMKAASGMKKSDVKDFASTKHKGIPEKVKEEDYIKGGLADKHNESEFDQEELKKGIEVEMEHTDNENMAKEIAMDHLTEFPKYYSALMKMEKELEDEPKRHKILVDKSLDNIDEKYSDIIKEFIKYCCKDLGINKPFRTFIRGKRGGPIITTASYNTVNNNVNVYARGRGLVDILRSVGHELRHLKQNIDGELIKGSGDDGSPQENEAHAFAGLMIRKFGKKYPEIYE